ncbi:MAG: hypothetical protein AAGC85_07210 [Bacteroidota bacterium]
MNKITDLVIDLSSIFAIYKVNSYRYLIFLLPENYLELHSLPPLMNFRLSTIFLLIGLFSFMGMTCKLTHYDPEVYKKPVILFGEGGGFSGKETTYALIKKGYLFKKVGTEEYELVRTVPVERCQAIFKQVKGLSPTILKTQQAGNMYQFMEVEVEKETYRMIWGNEGKKVDPKLKTLYKELIALYQQEM